MEVNQANDFHQNLYYKIKIVESEFSMRAVVN